MNDSILCSFSESIQARCIQLIEDINKLYYSNTQCQEIQQQKYISDGKTATYNILMDFIIKYQSDQVISYSQQEIDSFGQLAKQSDAFEIKFNTSKSLTGTFQQPMIFSINQSDFSGISNDQCNCTQRSNQEETFLNFPPGLPKKQLQNDIIPESPKSQPSMPRTPTKSNKKLFSTPKSPFQQFLNDRLLDSPKNGILDYDESCELSSLSSNNDDEVNCKQLRQRQYLRPEIDYRYKKELDQRLEKAEQIKQTKIQQVQMQAQTVSNKVDILKKKREEQQESLRALIQQKFESSERRRRQYLQNKISNKSSHDIKKLSIIIWQPQFNVATQFVQHSFIQSVKIIQNGVNQESIIFNLCVNLINFQSESIDFCQIIQMQQHASQQEVVLVQQQLAQLLILTTLYALFYNQDIMYKERSSLDINSYERVIVFDDNPVSQLSKSVYSIPGLINEPIYLKILHLSFKQMHESVTHFNNMKIFLEFCLSPKINSLVTIDQLILCLINKLQYPILPDEKIIKVCLQTQQDQSFSQEYAYVFDHFSSVSSVLQILQIFLGFPNFTDCIQEEQIFILFSSLVSQIAQILLSPQSYIHSFSKFDLAFKDSNFLFVEVQSILFQLIKLLVTLLNSEQLKFDFFNDEKLQQEYFTTTKLELISVLSMIFQPGIIYSEKDAMNFHLVQFSVRTDNNSNNVLFINQVGHFEYHSMLNTLVKQQFNTNANCYYQEGVYLALMLFQAFLKFEYFITYKELCIIFENVRDHLPLEVFVYSKTAKLFNELSKAMLLPVDLNTGFLQNE
ncbi:hypothetical protein SS50377_22129 [Spironucleus salmonicida]|uniref:Uncharacterized protein n=1 Tax=Spironucleus salmonicida TaxID=348837 RepID=V6LPS6_9EUKA|nr:hypothetical protein SS50377_22129 [Spironucleus salmonicida]|eukprot:EST45711.1 Hypothetical protein SS50377_14283 [Spironucleus salmonicida]